MADSSECWWKTVNEYLDDELADNDEDAKKIRTAEKEAKKKIVDARVHKKARGRTTWVRRQPRPNTATPYPPPTANNISPVTSPATIPRGLFPGGMCRKVIHALVVGNPGIGEVSVLSCSTAQNHKEWES